jgi:RimJ/RimL family protein N-acetyltransferase
MGSPLRSTTMTALDTQIDVRMRRLHLRTPRESDADRLYALFNNWEVMRWLSSPPWPYTLSDARSFINMRSASNPEFITAAIILDDAFIGVIDAIIKPASAVQRERGYSVGYWIGQPYWGHGYMSEAARRFIKHVFAIIPDDAIYSGAHAANTASLRIQEKLGFARDGEAMFFSNPHRKEVLHVNTSLARARFAAPGTGHATG